MKKIIYLYIAVLMFSKVQAEENKPLFSHLDTLKPAPRIFPIASATGQGYDSGSNIAVDRMGNVYITGYYSYDTHFGAVKMFYEGNADMFVAKYNKSGVLQWVKSGGGRGTDVGQDIAVDSVGNVYIIGSYEGGAEFDTTIITSKGRSAFFIAKYDTNGHLLWLKSGEVKDYATGLSLALDNKGNIYVAGTYNGIITFGDKSTPSGTSGFYVAMYDKSGNFQWSQIANGKPEVSKIAVDNNGKLYVAGWYADTLSFGSTSITSQGKFDMFLAKYDPTVAKWSWAQSAGGKEDEYGGKICLDKSGNVYMTGAFSDTTTFGSKTITSHGLYDFSLAKYTTDGQLQWVRSGGGTDYDIGTGVAVDKVGNVYLAGDFRDKVAFGSTVKTSKGSADIFVTKYNTNGMLQWVQTAGGIEHESPQGVAIDGMGNMYITGGYSGNISFGKTTLAHRAETDIYIMKLTP